MRKVAYISVIVPVFNEAVGLARFHAALVRSLKNGPRYEIVYCDDGSEDDSAAIIATLAAKDDRVRLITLSRNFGKEYALTAGLRHARGDAVVMIDADGQHPVALIKEFIARWRAGADVIVGVRDRATDRRAKLFYALFNRLTGEQLIPHSTDFRLLDRRVVDAFLQLDEPDRITRGLIDWVGFTRELVTFTPAKRIHGQATYSHRQLRKLAVDSFVSLSSVPLLLFGWLGIVITIGAGVLGLALLIEQVIAGDPLHWRFTGTAMLGTLILFLIGIVLMSQGMLALYISHIHTAVKRRPLYVIDPKRSIGVDE